MDENVTRALTEAGLAHLVAPVLADAHDEIWITATPGEPAFATSSRIGGVPHLPRGMPWPRDRTPAREVATWPEAARDLWQREIDDGFVIVERDPSGNPGGDHALALPFVAQIDLAEIAHLQTMLPSHGILWLFAEQTKNLGEVAGYDACLSACIYREDPGELVLADVPPVAEEFPPYRLTFAAARVYPDASVLDLPSDVWNRYARAMLPFDQPTPHHAMLIRPDYGANGTVPPPEWTGLLRVDTNDDQSMCWGDAAWITFAIPNDALRGPHFDAVRAFRWYG